MNSIVKKVIDKWDPINLLHMCPDDEYHPEIEAISKELADNTSYEELAKHIENTFVFYFSRDIFKKSYEDCYLIAKEILDSCKDIYPSN
ncbi:DUF1871 family protein [Tepidibacter sp. Z1-5]|uniref:DUF1871 family protein n=1 Tax=Tepidibacter sp. Z1-5 TaxID=3134138 RepID=UPI0030C5DDB8